MADIIDSTNQLQTSLQSATLDWCQVPNDEKLLKYLGGKHDDPSLPKDSYFGWLEEFLQVVTQSAWGCYDNRSFSKFHLERFIRTVA